MYLVLPGKRWYNLNTDRQATANYQPARGLVVRQNEIMLWSGEGWHAWKDDERLSV